MSIESDISQAAENKGQDDLCTTRYLDRARPCPPRCAHIVRGRGLKDKHDGVSSVANTLTAQRQRSAP